MTEENLKENDTLTELRDEESFEPESKKPKLDDVEDGEEADFQEQTSALTPSRKTRTPKISKEEREAERQKKLELRRLKEEEREKAKAEKERIAEEKRLEKEKKEKEREEKRKEEERRKAEALAAKEEKIKQKKKEEEERQKKRDEQAQRKREEEEQKRREEEAEAEKKRRVSERFKGFFKKVARDSPVKEKIEEQDLWYRPFQVKPGMVVAPIHRRKILKADQDIISQDEEVSASTYFSSDSVKHRKIVPARKIELKAKLFQFHDNYRPPYYGTWRKVDPSISGRRPGKPSSEKIDYEADSDAEWEDEPSDAEECRSDEEDPDVEEVDSDTDQFYVEHGYLSDGEGQDEEGDPEDMDAENRRERLAARASEWKRNVLNKPKSSYSALLLPFCAPKGLRFVAAGVVPAGMRQHSMSSVRKLNELVHECQVQLALFRHATQGIGTAQDGASLRREVETAGRACLKACEAARNCVLPQLRHEGVEFTRNASQFIGCVAAYVVEMKRCVALERTFPAPTEPSITPQQIANMESMLETLENLITVHFSTSESSPTDKVTPRRRRATSCRPQCVCSKLKTSYA